MESGSRGSAPPHPDTPLTSSGGAAPPGLSPQPGFYPGAPPPAGYQTVIPGVYPQPGFSPGAPLPAGYPGVAYTPVQHGAFTVVVPAMQENSVQAVCQHCQQTVLTNIEHTTGGMVWMMCAVLAGFGCYLCCFIPFCIDKYKDVEHRCPSCNKVIQTYRRNFYGGQTGYVTQAYI